MTFKEVGKELPEQWKFEKEGDFIQGIYAKKKTEVGVNNANLYLFEVEGKLRAVWGTTVIDNAMSDPKVKIGDLIRITYEGENKKPKYHKFKVEKDFDEINEMLDAVEDAVEEAESSD